MDFQFFGFQFFKILDIFIICSTINMTTNTLIIYVLFVFEILCIAMAIYLSTRPVKDE